MATITLAQAIAQIPDRVRGEMARRHLSYRDLANETGLSIGGLHRALGPEGNPRLSTLLAFQSWLDGGTER